MKRIIKIVCLLFIVFLSLPSAVVAEENNLKATSENFNWAPVMDAIVQVESEGNCKAVSGNSVGAMQITPILVVECNRILKRKKVKKRFKLSDRFSLAKSKEMFLIFQSYYNPMNSIEKAIRSWNGGLNYSMKRTQRYYENVMSYLK